MQPTPNIWLVGAAVGVFAGIFVATKEVLASGGTNIWGVLLTTSVAFVLGVALMSLRNWWAGRRHQGGQR